MPIEKIKFEEKEIILVGTAHISKKSVEEVRETIEKENPDAIGVELDEMRLRQLLEGKKWENTNIGEIINKGQSGILLLTILLSNMQKRIGQELGIKPGEEMLEAIRAAKEKQKPIFLLDRNVNITMKRAFQNMNIIEKAKLIAAITSSLFGIGEQITKEKIEELKKTDIITEIINEMTREMPGLKKALVDERDSYIANNIAKMPGKKIVVVVGAGHLQGIKQKIGKETIFENKTEETPQKSLFNKIAPYIIPTIFLTLIILILISNGIEALLKASLYWVIITGSFAALGTIIAKAHPYSIITAFISAPLTTLHPLIAVGFITGYVEAKIRTPKVKDFEDLQNINNLTDLSKNQVTKILLVVALSNLGATIGSFIGIAIISTMV
ncbi:MAG: TraB/GumN family protein [Candidatus Diapherotrites archaeon]